MKPHGTDRNFSPIDSRLNETWPWSFEELETYLEEELETYLKSVQEGKGES